MVGQPICQPSIYRKDYKRQVVIKENMMLKLSSLLYYDSSKVNADYYEIIVM